MKRWVASILSFLALLCWQAVETHARGRVALVIGNSSYLAGGKLATPGRDASAVAGRLERLGFDRVIVGRDMTAADMRSAVMAFSRLAAQAEIAVVFYAGRGLEIQGRNYLIPVDARLERAADAELEALGLDTVLAQINGARRLQLIVLETCRPPAFLRGQFRVQSIGCGAGVAPIRSGSNMLIAFANGIVAGPDVKGSNGNSLYVSSLLRHLGATGTDIRIMLDRVRNDVIAATQGRQTPFVLGTLGGSAVSLIEAEAAGPGGAMDGGAAASPQTGAGSNSVAGAGQRDAPKKTFSMRELLGPMYREQGSEPAETTVSSPAATAPTSRQSGRIDGQLQSERPPAAGKPRDVVSQRGGDKKGPGTGDVDDEVARRQRERLLLGDAADRVRSAEGRRLAYQILLQKRLEQAQSGAAEGAKDRQADQLSMHSAKHRHTDGDQLTSPGIAERRTAEQARRLKDRADAAQRARESAERAKRQQMDELLRRQRLDSAKREKDQESQREAERQRVAAEQARREAELRRQKNAEEAARRKAREAERVRVAALAAAARRAEEDRRRQEIEASVTGRLREAEQERGAALQAAAFREAEAEAERRRQAALAEARRRAEEEQRQQRDEEERRLAARAEAQRRVAESGRVQEAAQERAAVVEIALLRRLAEEAERRRQAELAEARRKAEEAARRQAEERQRRLAEEAERQRLAALEREKRRKELERAELGRLNEAGEERRIASLADKIERERQAEARRRLAQFKQCVASEQKARKQQTLKAVEAKFAPEIKKLVEVRLIQYGVFSGKPSGLFGTETRSAIKKFQAILGARQTGYLTACELQTLLVP